MRRFPDRATVRDLNLHGRRFNQRAVLLLGWAGKATPKPLRFDWVTHPRYRKRDIAVWVLVEDEMLHPGQTSPDLTVVGRGIPGLVVGSRA